MDWADLSSDGKNPVETKFLLCPSGGYSGNGTCISCSSGKFGTLPGGVSDSHGCAYNVTTCPHGFYCQGSGGAATPCPRGTYGNVTGGQTESESCKNCTSGRIALSEALNACVKCPKGAYCPNTTTKLLCTIGTYNNLTMQTVSCKNCIVGRFTSTNGMTFCDLEYCRPGYGHYKGENLKVKGTCDTYFIRSIKDCEAAAVYNNLDDTSAIDDAQSGVNYDPKGVVIMKVGFKI